MKTCVYHFPLQSQNEFCFSVEIYNTVNVLKFQTLLFLFSINMLFIKAGVCKILFRIANRENPDQTALQKQSDLGLHCLSGPYW